MRLAIYTVELEQQLLTWWSDYVSTCLACLRMSASRIMHQLLLLSLVRLTCSSSTRGTSGGALALGSRRPLPGRLFFSVPCLCCWPEAASKRLLRLSNSVYFSAAVLISTLYCKQQLAKHAHAALQERGWGCGPWRCIYVWTLWDQLLFLMGEVWDMSSFPSTCS